MTQVAAGDDDVGAALGGREGHLAAEPAAAAGDEHDAVVQVEELVRVAHLSSSSLHSVLGRLPDHPVDEAELGDHRPGESRTGTRDSYPSRC